MSIFVSACTGFGKKTKQEVAYPTIIWPGKPQKPRISFQQVVSNAGDLGIQKSFFTKVIEAVFGGGNHKALIGPMAVTMLQDGTLFVADSGAKGIHRFNIKQGEYDLLMQKDEKPMATPVALAVDGGRVFVADSTLGIYLIEPNSDIVEPMYLDQPPKQGTGIAFNSVTQRLYVTDTVEHHVKVFDDKGKIIKIIGKRGTNDGEFNFPTLLWLDENGRLYVTDTLNFRIQILSSEGEFIKGFGKMGKGGGYQARPKGVATDRYGHIYIVDSLNHAVQIFSQDGDYLLSFGAQGGDYGEFWLPTGIFIGGEDNTAIYVADTRNRRLQVFRYVGGEG